MNFTPEIEFSSTEKITQLQEEKLVVLLAYLSEHSRFYQEHFKLHGVDVRSIKTLADLSVIPPTTKNDLQQYNWDFLCVPRNRIAEYTSTSGTLGKPVTIALTKPDVERLAYNEAISFACADGNAADTYQLMLTLDRQFMAGIAYYEGIRALGAGLIRVGPGLPAMQWDTIQRIAPSVIVGVPSFFVKLLDYAREHGIDPNATSVKKAICIGENIRHEDLTLNALGNKIASSWNISLYSTYAATEMQTAFTECRHGKGGHLHPELIILELLDDQDRPIKDGMGEVTITTLGVEGMPLLRYKTGDVAVRFPEKCSCGRVTERLSPVLGRKQHMLKLKGTTIFPPGIFDILNEVPAVADYAVEVYTGALQTDELRIHVLFKDGEDQDDALKYLSTKFQSRLRIIPEMRLATPRILEALQGAGTNRKITRFIDLRTVTNK